MVLVIVFSVVQGVLVRLPRSNRCVPRCRVVQETGLGLVPGPGRPLRIRLTRAPHVHCGRRGVASVVDSWIDLAHLPTVVTKKVCHQIAWS